MQMKIIIIEDHLIRMKIKEFMKINIAEVHFIMMSKEDLLKMNLPEFRNPAYLNLKLH